MRRSTEPTPEREYTPDREEETPWAEESHTSSAHAVEPEVFSSIKMYRAREASRPEPLDPRADEDDDDDGPISEDEEELC